MPQRAKLITRSGTTANSTENLAKGSKLQFNEMDGNFIGLRDQSFGVVADDSATIDVKAGDTLYVQGTGGIQTSTDSAGQLTIDGSNLSSLGDLTAIGSTLVSPSNAAITLDPSGTGTIELNANTNITGDLSVSGSISGADITFVGDDSTGTAVDLGETFKFAGAGGVTTAVSGDTLTITGADISGFITASSTDTFTNKSFDANGTGNSITNIEVADLASGVLDTDLATVSASDDTLASAKAIKAYVDAQGGAVLGNLQVNDTTISPITTNSDIFIDAHGTGSIHLGGADSASEYRLKYDPTNRTLSFQQPGAGSNLPHYIERGDTQLIIRDKQYGDPGFEFISGLANGDGGIKITPIAGSTTGIATIGGPDNGSLYLRTGHVPLETNSSYAGGVTRIRSTYNGTIANPGDGIELIPYGDSKVKIDNNYWPNADGTSGQVLQTNGGGILSWVTPSSANTGDITFVGSTMSSPSNADFTIETAGTGKIILTGLTFPDTDGTADQILGTNGSGVLSFRDPTAINIDGGVADSVYTSVPTIDGGQA
jgi:hypothetical protein